MNSLDGMQTANMCTTIEGGWGWAGAKPRISRGGVKTSTYHVFQFGNGRKHSIKNCSIVTKIGVIQPILHILF